MSYNQEFVKGTLVDTNYGVCKILRYLNSKKILVKFMLTGFKTWTYASMLKTGGIYDPLKPSIRGVGYRGVGDYDPKTHRRLWNMFHNLLQRCFDEVFHKRQPSYIGCSVVKRWHNFQTFCADIVKMKNWDTPGFELDKDLRVIGNKIYGPDTCSFIPKKLNGSSKLLSAKGWAPYNYNTTKFIACIPIKYRNGKSVYASKKLAIAAFAEYRAAKMLEWSKEVKGIVHREVYSTLLSMAKV